MRPKLNSRGKLVGLRRPKSKPEIWPRPPLIITQAAEKVGGIAELARRLGVKHPTFYRWRQVPSGRVLKLEEVSGISRHDLRPDLYPRDK